MDTRGNLYTDALLAKVDGIDIISQNDIARVISLYISIVNQNGHVVNISSSYIDSYDGKTFYRRFRRFFDQMYQMFLRNGLDGVDRHSILKRVARRMYHIPKDVSSMEILNRIVIEETHAYLKSKRSLDVRRELVAKFRMAIKKYLHLTYELGYNEPSLCARELARSHKIDKYIMSGDFSVMLLPFMPEIEKEIETAYENYHMNDAWEMLKGRYFNHRKDYYVLSIEIKSNFTKNIPNFSEYFDSLYTDTYYKMMIGKEKK